MSVTIEGYQTVAGCKMSPIFSVHDGSQIIFTRGPIMPQAVVAQSTLLICVCGPNLVLIILIVENTVHVHVINRG